MHCDYMKMRYLVIIMIFVLCFQMDIVSAQLRSSGSYGLKNLNIRIIPGSGSVNVNPCIYWEINLKNAEVIELYFKEGPLDKRIYIKDNLDTGFFKFNSLKDKGITHCPFNKARKGIRSAVYYFKIKMKNKKKLITRTFVINREEK